MDTIRPGFTLLALDQSFSHSGYALIQPRAGRTKGLITYGSIKTVKSVPATKTRALKVYDDWQRIAYIKSIMLHLVTTHQVDLVVLEQHYIRQKFASAIQLQRLLAVLHVGLLDHGTPAAELAPNAWPKLLGLSGTKEPLLELVRPKGVTDNNQSDAIGIGLAWLQQQQPKPARAKKGTKLVGALTIVNSFEYSLGPCYKLS